MASKKVPPERNELIATIKTCAISYSISDYRLTPRRVDDEALLDLRARIETIGAKHKALIGRPIEIALGCSRSYLTERPAEDVGLPSMFSLTLRKDRCSTLIYLPSEVFWGLRPLLMDGHFNAVSLAYGRPRYGSADLITLAFEQ